MYLISPTLDSTFYSCQTPPCPVFLSANRAVQVFRLLSINKDILYNLSIGLPKILLYPVDLRGSECFLQDVECF